jgi:excisionase family DNA binding protein
MERLLYRVQEACELLSQGRTKIYEAIASGKLRSVRVGGSRLIPADALRDYAERLAAGDNDQAPERLTTDLASSRATDER